VGEARWGVGSLELLGLKRKGAIAGRDFRRNRQEASHERRGCVCSVFGGFGRIREDLGEKFMTRCAAQHISRRWNPPIRPGS